MGTAAAILTAAFAAANAQSGPAVTDTPRTPANELRRTLEGMPSANELIVVPKIHRAHREAQRELELREAEDGLARRTEALVRDREEWAEFIANADAELRESVHAAREDQRLGVWVGVVGFIADTALQMGLDSLEADLERHSLETAEGAREAVPEGRRLDELDTGVIELCETEDGPCTMVGMRSLVEEAVRAEGFTDADAFESEVERRVHDVGAITPTGEGIACIESTSDCLHVKVEPEANWTEREGDVYAEPKLVPDEAIPAVKRSSGEAKPIRPILWPIEWGAAGAGKAVVWGAAGAGKAVVWGAKVVGKGKLAIKSWRAAIAAQTARHALQHVKAANRRLVVAYNKMSRKGNFAALSDPARNIAERIRAWDTAVLGSTQVLGKAGTRLPRKSKYPRGLQIGNLSDTEIIALGRYAVCGGVLERCRVIATKMSEGGLALISRIGNSRLIRRFRAKRVLQGRGTPVKVNAEIVEVPAGVKLGEKLSKELGEKLVKQQASPWGNLHLDP